MSTTLSESVHFRASRETARKLKEMAKREGKTEADIMRLILNSYFAGDSKLSVITIASPLGDRENTSFFAGDVRSLREQWRDVRSRINMPRPINPDDSAAVEEWRKQKELIAAYFAACDVVKKRLEALMEFFSGLTPNEYDNLKRLGEMTRETLTAVEQQQRVETDPEKLTRFDAYIVFYGIVLKWLSQIGVTIV